MNYSELTRRYFERAAGAGVLAGPGVGRGAAGSRAQGTWVQFDVAGAWQAASADAADGAGAGEDTQLTVVAARFLAFACPHTIAVASWVVECSSGAPACRKLPESVQDIARRFEVPIEKLGRLLIVEDAWAAAVAALFAAPRPATPARIAT